MIAREVAVDRKGINSVFRGDLAGIVSVKIKAVVEVQVVFVGCEGRRREVKIVARLGRVHRDLGEEVAVFVFLIRNGGRYRLVFELYVAARIVEHTEIPAVFVVRNRDGKRSFPARKTSFCPYSSSGWQPSATTVCKLRCPELPR